MIISNNDSEKIIKYMTNSYLTELDDKDNFIPQVKNCTILIMVQLRIQIFLMKII